MTTSVVLSAGGYSNTNYTEYRGRTDPQGSVSGVVRRGFRAAHICGGKFIYYEIPFTGRLIDDGAMMKVSHKELLNSGARNCKIKHTGRKTVSDYLERR